MLFHFLIDPDPQHCSQENYFKKGEKTRTQKETASIASNSLSILQRSFICPHGPLMQKKSGSHYETGVILSVKKKFPGPILLLQQYPERSTPDTP